MHGQLYICNKLTFSVEILIQLGHLSLSLPVSLSISLYLSLYLSLSLPVSFSISPCISLYLSLYLSLSPCISFSLSMYLFSMKWRKLATSRGLKGPVEGGGGEVGTFWLFDLFSKKQNLYCSSNLIQAQDFLFISPVLIFILFYPKKCTYFFRLYL